MSYYFTIIGTKDNPLFEHEFGTSKQGGDGVARFADQARHMNQFIVHSSLDIVEEVQWASGQMYLKVIDRFYNNYVSCFLTGGNIKFLLLHAPHPPNAPPPPQQSSSMTPSASTISSISSSSTTTATTSTSITSTSTTRNSTSIGANPTAPATEEAIRQFFTDVYEVWIKTLMNPFYRLDMEVRSPVFRQRVAAAGKKYL